MTGPGVDRRTRVPLHRQHADPVLAQEQRGRQLFGDPLLVRQGLALVPTPRAESLRQPVQEALSLIQHALDNRPGFDPAADRATFTVSCSDYSLLMLIGPLVRRLAATAPGLTIQVLPRASDAVRLLRDGDVDLVIEPIEISFLLAPFLLQGTDLVAVVPERAAGHLRRTADVRFLEPPMDLPPITEMLWWNPRHTMDPAHAWLRARIAEIATELDQTVPVGTAGSRNRTLVTLVPPPSQPASSGSAGSE